MREPPSAAVACALQQSNRPPRPGLNMPAKTVVFTALRKFDGQDFRWASPAPPPYLAAKPALRPHSCLHSSAHGQATSPPAPPPGQRPNGIAGTRGGVRWGTARADASERVAATKQDEKCGMPSEASNDANFPADPTTRLRTRRAPSSSGDAAVRWASALALTSTTRQRFRRENPLAAGPHWMTRGRALTRRRLSSAWPRHGRGAGGKERGAKRVGGSLAKRSEQ